MDSPITMLWFFPSSSVRYYPPAAYAFIYANLGIKLIHLKGEKGLTHLLESAYSRKKLFFPLAWLNGPRKRTIHEHPMAII